MDLTNIEPKPQRHRLQFSRQWHDGYLVGGLILLGLLLRLPSLRLGLWRDEASTFLDAVPSELWEVVRRVIHSELNPPGFYLFVHQWIQWFGTEEIVLKLPPLLFGLLTIPAVYGLGRVVDSRPTGLMAAAIATLAPKAIYYSQEVRPYSLTALLCCLVVLSYCKAIESNHQRWYSLGFVLSTEMLLYVQYTGLLLIGSLLVVTVYLWRREPEVKVVPFSLSFGAVFLLFAPWLPIFLTHLHAGTRWWDKSPWWMWPKLVIGNLAYSIPLTQSLQLLSIIPVLLTLGMGGWYIFFGYRQSSRLRGIFPNARAIVLGMSLVLLAGLLAALGYGVPGTGRYMFAFTPIAWVLYSSWAIALFRYCDRRWNRPFRNGLRLALLSLIICGLVLPNVSQALSFGNVPKSGLRALAADARQQPREQTFYVLGPDYLGPSFDYYLARVRPVPFFGFARWDRPEIFSPQGYAQLWQAPAVVSDTERRIREEAKRGYDQLAFVKDRITTPLHDGGEIPFSRTEQLLSDLQQTYPLLQKIDYPGKDEPVTLYLFDLKRRS